MLKSLLPLRMTNSEQHVTFKNNKKKRMKTLKTIVTLLLFITSLQSFAFTKKVKGNGNVVTESRTTNDYDRISVGGSFEVTLISGEEGELNVQIEDNLKQYLITKVEKGTLMIKWKKGINIYTKKGIRITIPFKDIEGVSLAGSGNITSEATINADDLSISIAGSGDINLVVEALDINSRIAGSGNLKINGSSENLICRLAGSGNFKGYELNVTNADTKIAGSGNIQTSVNSTLKAKIAGSGNVHYKGSPTTNVKISGSGNVTSK
jgi:hypothetical protein